MSSLSLARVSSRSCAPGAIELLRTKRSLDGLLFRGATNDRSKGLSSKVSQLPPRIICSILLILRQKIRFGSPYVRWKLVESEQYGTEYFAPVRAHYPGLGFRVPRAPRVSRGWDAGAVPLRRTSFPPRPLRERGCLFPPGALELKDAQDVRLWRSCRSA